jgi:hypothetical protein
VHPIEHLRYLARTDSADAAGLVAETATALGALRGEHANLVVAARRIVERHPSVGPLWWLCAHLLVSDDARELAWDLADEVSADPTSALLAAELPIAAHVLTGGFHPTIGAAGAERPDVAITCLALTDGARRVASRIARFGPEIDLIGASELADAAAAADVVLVMLTAGSAELALTTPDAAATARAGAAAGTPVWLVAPLGTCLPRRYVEAIAEGAGDLVADVDPALAERLIGPLGTCADVATALGPTAPIAPELLRAIGAR